MTKDEIILLLRQRMSEKTYEGMTLRQFGEAIAESTIEVVSELLADKSKDGGNQ